MFLEESKKISKNDTVPMHKRSQFTYVMLISMRNQVSHNFFAILHKNMCE